MSSSGRRNTIRGILITSLVNIVAAGCDPTAPLDPKKDTDALVVDAARMVAGASITASAIAWNEIDLSWGPTTQSVSGYEVYRSTSGAAGPYTLITTTAATVGNYADRGLTASTEYCYQVRSFKRVGKNTTYSTFSSAACATTAPPPVAAPSETNATPQAKLIVITWKDNSANEEGFAIQRAPTPDGSWTQVANASANSTSANVSATAEEQVCFRVIAFAYIGPSLPSIPDCTTVPGIPWYFGARVVGATITLSWQDNSAVEEGYRISRREGGGVWTDLATLPANSGGDDAYQDVGVTTGVRYTYRVQALKDGGYSEMSNEAWARIATSLPAAPTDASGGFFSTTDPPSNLYLSVGWTDNSSNEDGFRIYYSPPYGDLTEFARTDENVTVFFQEIGRAGEPQAGCFSVVAFNSLGESEPSNSFCSQAPEGLPTGSMIVSSPTRPPTGAGQRPRSDGPGRTTLTNPARVKQVPRHVPPVPVIPSSF